ncbi:hypothetical protein ACIQC0_06900 [Pseudarthrobacter sp. NPDC092419]|uniref:hypothetical protein n=1 Tax=Pseudarthrobacter sp. NPDC092419 TaxID=3364414 RepID=UPI00383010B6
MKHELQRGPKEEVVDAPALELRVHGIGDQHLLDALGHPPVLFLGYPTRPDTLAPPRLPNHELRLINWSRTSRRAARFLWYLALPFTLINVAANMAPPPNGHGTRVIGWMVRFIAVIIGLVMTVSLHLWGVAIIETGFRWIRLPSAPQLPVVPWLDPGSSQFPNLVVTTVIALGIILRVIFLVTRRLTANPVALGLIGALHLTAVLATSAVLYFSPPTLWRAPTGLGWLTVQSPTTQDQLEQLRSWHATMPLAEYCTRLVENPQLFTTRWDTLTALVASSVGLTLLLGVLLIASGYVTKSQMVPNWPESPRVSDKRAPRSPSLAGAALVLIIAVSLFQATGSALRFGVGWIATYLDGFDGFTIFQDGTGLSPLDRLVMPAYGGACEDAGAIVDRIPLYGLVCLLILVLSAFLINAVLPHGARWPREWERTQRAEYIHRFIGGLPHTLLPSLLLALAASAYAGNALLLSSWIRGPLGESLSALISQVIAVAIVVFMLLAGHMHSVSKIYNQIADVAGFWPVEWHPWAGRSYRETVIQGVTNELNRQGLERIALVGHSQGSVICAWLLVHTELDNDRRVHLITCGSPLYSLYAAFFPAHFSENFFARLSNKSISLANFWRKTDPIATPIPSANRLDNVLLDDPLEPDKDPEPRVHSDYWIDPDQIEHIRQKLKP